MNTSGNHKKNWYVLYPLLGMSVTRTDLLPVSDW